MGINGEKWWKRASELFTGSFTRNLDAKLRVAVPKPLRAVLGYPESSEAFLAPGTDRSLALYSVEAFERLGERMSGLSPTARDVRSFRRLFYSQAEQVELDRQGRIRIPVRLASLAELETDAVLLGVQDHVEIWQPALWEQYLSVHTSQYDELAERAFGEGSGGTT